VSVFGGTVPLVSQALVQGTGNIYTPAMYVMFFSIVAFAATFFLKETARKPLLGSVPVVESYEEAMALCDGQDKDENLDTRTMILVAMPAESK